MWLERDRPRAWKHWPGQPGKSHFSRACLLSCFLSASIWVAVGLSPETESAKGELAPLWRASPVAYGAHRGPPRWRSIWICGGHSPELNRSLHQVFRCPPGAWRTSWGLHVGAQAQAHLPPPPAAETRSFRKFSSAYKLQEQGQRHWGRDPLLSPCLMTVAGLLFPGCLILKKKKKAPGMLEMITFTVEMPFVRSFNIWQIFTPSCFCVQLGVMFLTVLLQN